MNKELLFESLQRYVALGFSQLRARLEVNDAEVFQTYIAKQNEFVKIVGDGFVGDAKAVAELGSEIRAKVQELGQENMKAVNNRAV